MDAKAPHIPAGSDAPVASGLSGDSDGVERAVRSLVERQRLIRRLEERAREADVLVWVGNAYHQRHAELRDLLLDAARALKYNL